MKQREYTAKNRSNWGSGPWDSEPDKVQFVDEATKLPCLAVRNHGGAWCGYVGVPPEHPHFGMGYNDVVDDYKVHGGLTFAGYIPAPGKFDRVWWLGFDCNHCDDLAPAMPMFFIRGQVYRTLDYVKEQCAKLAAQIATA